MGRLFIGLIVLCVVLSNVKSYDLYEKVIAAIRNLKKSLASKPIEVQERMLGKYLGIYARHLPSAVRPFNMYEDEDTLSDESLGLGRSGQRKSYPWEKIRRRYFANTEDAERFPVLKELRERESRMPEDKFPSEIESF